MLLDEGLISLVVPSRSVPDYCHAIFNTSPLPTKHPPAVKCTHASIYTLPRKMALRNLLACISSAGGSSDLPCIILHSPLKEVAMTAARALLASLCPRNSGPARTERHVLSAVDPGRHTTHFDYERAATSLMIDLSQSEVARCAALDWLAPIAPTKHVLGARRTIVLHCAELLSWAHQNALKKIIESSQSNTLFILTTSQAAGLQSAIISRGIVIRCPSSHVAPPVVSGPSDRVTVAFPEAVPLDAVTTRLPPTAMNLQGRPNHPLPCAEPQTHDGVVSGDHHLPSNIESVILKALASSSPASAVKACRDASHSMTKGMLETTPSALVRNVMEVLLETCKNDPSETWCVIQDLARVDVQVALARTPISKIATMTVALNHTLLSACVRRVKINV